MEFVIQFEGEVNGLREFLQEAKTHVDDARDRGSAYHEETWLKLREVKCLPVPVYCRL